MTAKKKSQAQQMREMLDEAIKQVSGAQIRDSHFIGVQFDKAACESISKIADGLAENARGLSALAETLNAANIRVDCMVKIDQVKR